MSSWHTPLSFSRIVGICLCVAWAAYARSEEITVSAPFPMPAIIVPAFAARDFAITDFGAVEGDQVKITAAIMQAIQACHTAGGGRVVVPRGRWLTGAIHLRSNINLHLAEGAVLEFSDNPQDYLPAVQTSWEGMECFNYSPLVYAFGCENVALTGPGTMEARLDTWRKWYARPPAHMEALKQLYHMMSKGVPVEERQMAVGENNLRPHFIQFNRCKNILIEGVKIRNSPFWTVHLLLCENAVVRRVDISAHGHNNDGIDPEMTRNLLVEDCVFDQGDDAIAIKAGRNRDGWRLNVPTENIVIRRCTMRRGHQLVAIGSELSAGIRNVYVHDCTFVNDPADPPQHILFIKTNRRSGGFVENIHVEGITANSTKVGVFGIETDVLYQWRNLVPTYEERLTRIRGIHFRNVTVDETEIPFRILGDAQMPVSDVFIENVTIKKVRGQARRFENVEGVHEQNVRIAPPATGPYDETADARSDIKAALAAAKNSKTRVLVVFGANWCGDCKALDTSFRSDTTAPLIGKFFTVVKVNVGRFDRNVDIAETYGVPLKQGIPAIAVLDAEGKVSFATRAGELANAMSMGKKGIHDFFAKLADGVK